MCIIPWPMGQSWCWIKFNKKLTCCLAFTFAIADLLVDKTFRPQKHLCNVSKISQFVFRVLAQRFYFTHIYIPYILSLFNYIQSNGELRCFELIDSIIKKLEKKALDCINHVIYTPDSASPYKSIRATPLKLGHSQYGDFQVFPFNWFNTWRCLCSVCQGTSLKQSNIWIHIICYSISYFIRHPCF